VTRNLLASEITEDWAVLHEIKSVLAGVAVLGEIDGERAVAGHAVIRRSANGRVEPVSRDHLLGEVAPCIESSEIAFELSFLLGPIWWRSLKPTNGSHQSISFERSRRA
jgi:hypothetical protein